MNQRMKALRSFRYATRMLQAGEEFDANRQDARVLSAIGRAAAVEAKQPEIEDDETPRRAKRKAKTKDEADD